VIGALSDGGREVEAAREVREGPVEVAFSPGGTSVVTPFEPTNVSTWLDREPT
jgi:hypothetical protein